MKELILLLAILVLCQGTAGAYNRQSTAGQAHLHARDSSHFTTGHISNTANTPQSTVCRSANIATAVPYEPCYEYHSMMAGMMGDNCPYDDHHGMHFFNQNNSGCCTQSATLTIPSGKPACCPCGSVCTGSIPAMISWTLSAG